MVSNVDPVVWKLDLDPEKNGYGYPIVVVVYQCTIINVMVPMKILKRFFRARFTLC